MTSVPASISFTNNNQTVEITPEAPLPPSTQMTLTISGRHRCCRATWVATHTTHFTTGTAAATAAPGVVTANPVPNATGGAVERGDQPAGQRADRRNVGDEQHVQGL